MSIPSKARKLTFNDQTWHWMLCGADRVIIWSPEDKKFIAPKWKVLGWESPPRCWWDDIGDRERTVLPGNVRKYIHEEILEDAPAFSKDTSAIIGKLYVFKHGSLNHEETPNATIEKMEPTGFVTAQKFLDHLSEGKPIFLLNHWVDKEKKIGYYKVLADNFMVTFKIAWPRTWSGSFVEAKLEKFNE